MVCSFLPLFITLFFFLFLLYIICKCKCKPKQIHTRQCHRKADDILLSSVRLFKFYRRGTFSSSAPQNTSVWEKHIMPVLLYNSSPIIDLFTGPWRNTLTALLFQNNNDNSNNNPNAGERLGRACAFTKGEGGGGRRGVVEKRVLGHFQRVFREQLVRLDEAQKTLFGLCSVVMKWCKPIKVVGPNPTGLSLFPREGIKHQCVICRLFL